jgi:hypothetical protein
VPVSERLSCVVIPWIGFFVLSGVLIRQNTVVPDGSSLVLGGDVLHGARAVPLGVRSDSDPSLHPQHIATQQQQHQQSHAEARQPAVDHGGDGASNETWPVSRCTHISAVTSGLFLTCCFFLHVLEVLATVKLLWPLRCECALHTWVDWVGAKFAGQVPAVRRRLAV